MKLSTPVPDPNYPFKLDHNTRFLSLGSCFAHSIAEKLAKHGYRVTSNPFGTIYNPRVFEIIANQLNEKDPKAIEDSIFEKRALWYSYHFHSEIRSKSGKELLELIQKKIRDCLNILKGSSVLILTLGTSKVFQLSDSNLEVGNCHKMPNGLFTSRLLGQQEIITSLKNTLHLFRQISPDLKVIITVSPVRHTADRAEINQRSKARLILAAEEIVEQDRSAFYFPSYEIMMDELRDYRFYDHDLVHPSDLAIEIIWERFREVVFSDGSLATGRAVEKIKRGLAHKAFNPASADHQKFLSKLLKDAQSTDIAPLVEPEIRALKELIRKKG